MGVYTEGMAKFQRHDLFALKTSEYLHDNGGGDNVKADLSLLRVLRGSVKLS